MKVSRGALIVIEGLDRTGKSTQCKNLVENLRRKQVKSENINFPNRNTEIGSIINSYLSSKNDLPDEVIHLLFSANRWEKAKEIVKTIEEGVTVITDRYCYSGVAYSAAKGLDIDWCKSSDVGLPKPDKVFFLTMPFDKIEGRKGYGDEKYEVSAFQKKVGDTFLKLQDDSWDILDANRSVENIENELLEKTLKVLRDMDKKPLDKLCLAQIKKNREEILSAKRIASKIRYDKLKFDPELGRLRKEKDKENYLKKKKNEKIRNILIYLLNFWLKHSRPI